MPSMAGLPGSLGITPVVGCVSDEDQGLWISSVTRNCQLPVYLTSVSCLYPCAVMDGGGLGRGRQFAHLWFCFFPLGLATMSTGHSDWNVVSAPSWPVSAAAKSVGGRGLWKEGQLSCLGIFFLGDVSCYTRARALCTASSPLSLGSASVCTGHSDQSAASASPFCWVEIEAWPSPATMARTRLVRLHLQVCPSHILPPLLTPVCAPSDVSMHRSLRLVCVLSRESFVEFYLSNL